MLSTSVIRAWLTGDTAKFEAPQVVEALQWARARWREQSLPIAESECRPDNLYAITRVIREDPDALPESILAWYEYVDTLTWPAETIDEKRDLQSQLAYCVSRQSRRSGEYASSWRWQGKCVALTLQLPSVSELLALSGAELTGQLIDRYLRDPCVLVAFCAGLPKRLNLDPREYLVAILAAHDHVMREGSSFYQPEERAWFLAQLEMLAAVGCKHCGRYSDAEKWLRLAERTCTSVVGGEIVLALIEYVCRSVAFETREFQNAWTGISSLTTRFEEFGMQRYVALCVFLEGVSLWALGREEEALQKVRFVGESVDPEVDAWLRGLALTYTANILARKMQDSAAFLALAQAWTLLKESNVPSSFAHFHGVKGEILRDRGQLETAIESYRSGVAVYESAQLRSQEATLRLILAETLLAAGRDRDAVDEIVTALPIIETLGLVREGVVAVALLRESLSRREVNPEALKTLNHELQKLSKGGRS